MKINKNVYHKILFSCPESPIETGGIIGGTENTIKEYIMDIKECEYGKYTPKYKISKQTN